MARLWVKSSSDGMSKYKDIVSGIIIDIMAPVGELFGLIPHTLRYSIYLLNPKRAVWIKRFNQHARGGVWFDRYPSSLHKINIGKNSSSNGPVHNVGGISVTIGDNVRIGRNVEILGKNGKVFKKGIPFPIDNIDSGTLVLKGNIWVGDGVTFLVSQEGLTVEKGITIGVGSIVTKDLNKKNSVYVGVPARRIGLSKMQMFRLKKKIKEGKKIVLKKKTVKKVLMII